MAISIQTLAEADRRRAADWAAICANRVLHLFEAERPEDSRPRDAIARAQAFARGDLDAATGIRQRFGGGSAGSEARSPAAVAAARAAGQASAVCHMGAHALGAAAYAVKAAALAAPEWQSAVEDEIDWQMAQLSPELRIALRSLPPLGESRSGPLGPGLLASGQVGEIIRQIQQRLAMDAL